MLPEIFYSFCLTFGVAGDCQCGKTYPGGWHAFLEAPVQAQVAPGGVIVNRHEKTPWRDDEREHPHIELVTATASATMGFTSIDMTKVLSIG